MSVGLYDVATIRLVVPMLAPLLFSPQRYRTQSRTDRSR